jgi:hypothetical protein
MSKEMNRRAYLIRIDAGMENPAKRANFRHSNLLVWAKEHRGELIWAALTLCQAWIAKGKPKGSQVMGSYQPWVDVLGGILDVASIGGFLANDDEKRKNMVDRQSEWNYFVIRWFGEYASQSVGVEKLFKLCQDHQLLDRVLGDKSERSQRTKLGKALSSKRDTIIEDFRIVEVNKDHSGRQQYKLQQTINYIHVEKEPLDVMIKPAGVQQNQGSKCTATANIVEDLMREIEWVA